MPKPRLDDSQLASILQASARVIARRRADGTRLADVAKEAKVSVGTLQHYFGNRDDLVAATFEAISDQEIARCRAVVGRASGVTGRLQVVVSGLLGTVDDWLLWTELWASAARVESYAAHNERVFAAWLSLTREIVEDGASDGTFRPRNGVDAASILILRFVEGLGVQLMLGRISVEESREVLMDLVNDQLGLLS